jgi:hypothetical protein
VEECRQRHAGEHHEPDQVGDEQNPPSIPAIGVDADDQAEEQERQELERAHDPQLEWRLGQLQNEPGKGEDCDLVADRRNR